MSRLFKDRTVVGYHIIMKCEDLGVEVPPSYHDASKMFNESPISGQQWQMSKLCTIFLNINFKKPSTSYAVRDNRSLESLGNRCEGVHGSLQRV